jgi:phenylalanine-4-hydroxylase
VASRGGPGDGADRATPRPRRGSEDLTGDDVRPLDLLAMGTAEYDVTRFQPVLYRVESLEHLLDAVGGFFATMDDETPRRLGAV